MSVRKCCAVYATIAVDVVTPKGRALAGWAAAADALDRIDSVADEAVRHTVAPGLAWGVKPVSLKACEFQHHHSGQSRKQMRWSQPLSGEKRKRQIPRVKRFELLVRSRWSRRGGATSLASMETDPERGRQSDSHGLVRRRSLPHVPRT